MRFFAIRRRNTKGGFVPLAQPAMKESDFFDNEDRNPAKASYNMEKYSPNDDEEKALPVKKRDIRSIMTTLKSVSLRPLGDSLNSSRQEDTNETTSTASGSTTFSSDGERIRPVLITVNDSPKLVKPKAVKAQYSPDILAESDFETPLRRQLFDDLSVVESYSPNDSTAFGEPALMMGSGDSIYEGESAIDESTTFGASEIGESEFGSGMGESVFTTDSRAMNGNFYSNRDADDTVMTDDYTFTTSSYSEKQKSTQQPCDAFPDNNLPKFVKDMAGIIQDIMDDIGHLSTYMTSRVEHTFCGDISPEDVWRDVSLTPPRGRSRHR